jgi:hypothetical protein
MIFLIDYDRRVGRLVKLITFRNDQREEAQNSRLQLELALADSQLTREIVLLEASDEEALRRTHRRYFEALSELAQSPDKK